MNQTMIAKICGREIYDSRGNPTVEAEVTLCDGSCGRGMVPSGASTGQYEAVELRDGRSVKKAVRNVNEKLQELLSGKNAEDISLIDHLMLEEDGTTNKSKLGANAMLAVSMACCCAAAKSRGIPLYRFVGGVSGNVMPVPMMNILNGGRHAANRLDFQEFMIMPIGAKNFREALHVGTEVYHKLKEVLMKRGLSVGVGDEGGFAPEIAEVKDVFVLISEAVKEAGYEVGKDIVYALDAAASELYIPEEHCYYFAGEKIAGSDGFGVRRTTEEMICFYEELVNEFPIASIEDGLDQNDWTGWKELTKRLGHRVQLVGDDLFVTNPKRLQEGIEKGCANAILIKPNQIGTVSETLETIRLAKRNGYRTIISHRSGETEDSFIADIAVAVNAGQIKTGAPCRGERMAKYNRLLRIEEELGEKMFNL